MIALLNVLIQSACLGAACRYLWNDPEWHWATMPGYLTVVVATEAFGGYLGHMLGLQNVPLYNLFLLVEGTFISIFTYRLCRPYGLRLIHWCCWMVLFLGTYAVELILAGSFSHYATTTIFMASLSFVAACVYYALGLLRQMEFGMPLIRHAPTVWMVSVAYFYFGTLVVGILAKPIIALRLELFGLPVYSLVHLMLNFIMYTLWIYTFMCRFRSRTSP